MKKKPTFIWHDGFCTCSIVLDDFLSGFGVAECAEADEDMMSERTGKHIAETRAQIDLLQNYKNIELRPELKAYKHLLGTMQQSKKYNPNSYEAKRLNKEIKNVKKTIAEINEAINTTKKELKEYIDTKEKLYQRIRNNDHEGYKDEDSITLQKDIDMYNNIIKDGNKT